MSKLSAASRKALDAMSPRTRQAIRHALDDHLFSDQAEMGAEQMAAQQTMNDGEQNQPPNLIDQICQLLSDEGVDNSVVEAVRRVYGGTGSEDGVTTIPRAYDKRRGARDDVHLPDVHYHAAKDGVTAIRRAYDDEVYSQGPSGGGPPPFSGEPLRGGGQVPMTSDAQRKAALRAADRVKVLDGKPARDGYSRRKTPGFSPAMDSNTLDNLYRRIPEIRRIQFK
jgi:hypothetical protein